jgi:death-on-curing protein
VRVADVVFLEVEDVHEAHAAGLAHGGGTDGVRDLGMILSATMGVQSGYYSTLAELAAAYVHGIARNHGYIDGNKRTAANVLMMFLGANGFRVVLADEWVSILERVASGLTTRHELADIIVARLLHGKNVAILP